MSIGERVVAAARDWIGTPYRHQASVKGVGCDCLGLVRGVWREVVGDEPERAPPYSPDWAEMTGEETLLDAARRHLEEIAIGDARVGDVLLFRMGLGAVAKHVGIVSACAPASSFDGLRMRPAETSHQPHAELVEACEASRIIHAYWGRAVCETSLVPWWRRRIAGAFRFPV